MQPDAQFETKRTSNELNSSTLERERVAKLEKSRAASRILNRKLDSITENSNTIRPFEKETEVHDILETLREVSPALSQDYIIKDADFEIVRNSDGIEVTRMTIPTVFSFNGMKLQPHSIFTFDRSNYQLMSIEIENLPGNELSLVDDLYINESDDGSDDDLNEKFTGVQKIYYEVVEFGGLPVALGFASEVNQKYYIAAVEGRSITLESINGSISGNKAFFFEHSLSHPTIINDSTTTAHRVDAQEFNFEDDYGRAEEIFNEVTKYKKVKNDIERLPEPSELDREDSLESQELKAIITKLGLLNYDLILLRKEGSIVKYRIPKEFNYKGTTIIGGVLIIDYNEPSTFEIYCEDDTRPEESTFAIPYIEIGKVPIYSAKKMIFKYEDYTHDIEIDQIIVNGMIGNDRLSLVKLKKTVDKHTQYIGYLKDGRIIEVTEDGIKTILDTDFRTAETIYNAMLSSDQLVSMIQIPQAQRIMNEIGLPFLRESSIRIAYTLTENGRLDLKNFPEVHANLKSLRFKNISHAYVNNDLEKIVLISEDGNLGNIFYKGVFFYEVRRIYIDLKQGQIYFNSAQYVDIEGELYEHQNKDNVFVGFNPQGLFTTLNPVDGIGYVQSYKPLENRIRDEVQLTNWLNAGVEKQLRVKRVQVLGIPMVSEYFIKIGESSDNIIINDKQLDFSEDIGGNPKEVIFLRYPADSIAHVLENNGIAEVSSIDTLTIDGSTAKIINTNGYLEVTGIEKVYLAQRQGPSDIPKATNLTGKITFKVGDQIYRTDEITITTDGFVFTTSTGINILIAFEGIFDKKFGLGVNTKNTSDQLDSVNIPSRSELFAYAKQIENLNDLSKAFELISLTRWSYESCDRLYGAFTIEEWIQIYRPYFMARYKDKHLFMDELEKYAQKPNSVLENQLDGVDFFFLYITFKSIHTDVMYGSTNIDNALTIIPTISNRLRGVYKGEFIEFINEWLIPDAADLDLREQAVNSLYVAEESSSINSWLITTHNAKVEGYDADKFIAEKGQLQYLPENIDLALYEATFAHIRDLATTPEIEGQIERLRTIEAKADMNTIGQISKVIEILLGIRIQSNDLATNFVIFGVVLDFAQSKLSELKKLSFAEQQIKLNELQVLIRKIKNGELEGEELGETIRSSNTLKVLLHLASGTLPKEYIIFTMLTLISSGIEIAEISNVIGLDNVIARNRGGEKGIDIEQYKTMISNVLNQGEYDETELSETIIKALHKVTSLIRHHHNYESYSKDYLILSHLLNLDESSEFASNCWGIGLITIPIIEQILEGIPGAEVFYASLHSHFNNSIEDWFDDLDKKVLAGHAIIFVTLPDGRTLIVDPLLVINNKGISCVVLGDKDIVRHGSFETEGDMLEESTIISINPSSKVRVIKSNGKGATESFPEDEIYQVFKDRSGMLATATLSNFLDMDEYLHILSPDSNIVMPSLIFDSSSKVDRRALFEKYMRYFYRYRGFNEDSVNFNAVMMTTTGLLKFAMDNNYFCDALFLVNVMMTRLERHSEVDITYDINKFEAHKQHLLTQLGKLSPEELKTQMKKKKYLLREMDIQEITTNQNFRLIIEKIKGNNEQMKSEALRELELPPYYQFLFEEFRYQNINEQKELCRNILETAINSEVLEVAVYIVDMLLKLEQDTDSEDTHRLNILRHRIIKLLKSTDITQNEILKYRYLLGEDTIDDILKTAMTDGITKDIVLNYFYGKEWEISPDDYESISVKLEKSTTAMTQVLADLFTKQEQIRVENAIASNTYRIEDTSNQLRASVVQNGITTQALHQETQPLALDKKFILLTPEAASGSIDYLIKCYTENVALALIAVFHHGIESEFIAARLQEIIKMKGLTLPPFQDAAELLANENLPLLSSNSSI